MKTILDMIEFAHIRAGWYDTGVKDSDGDNVRFLNESINSLEAALIYLKNYRDVENIEKSTDSFFDYVTVGPCSVSSTLSTGSRQQ